MKHLTVDQLDITYGENTGSQIQAVKGFDLSVDQGEFISIIGPSGCGKSSILHTMGGLQKPTRGDIQINGNRVDGPDAHVAAFVFQEYTLFPWLNITDNVAFGLKCAGVAKRARSATAVASLDVVGLKGFENVYPSELSGGMQQRAAIARALVMQPECLLLDEPFGAVDEMTRRRLGVELAGNLKAQGQTVVIVTHSLEEAIFWSDRIVVMSSRPGRVLDIVEVDQAWPRTWDFAGSSEANHLRTRLLELLPIGREEQ